MKFHRHSLSFLVLTAVLLGNLLWGAQAQAPATNKKGTGDVDLSKFPGEVMEDVVIPVPSEIFSVLEKLGDPDWKREISVRVTPKFSDRIDIALLLGTVVADGFLAVQAQDSKTVETIGRKVLELSKALGLQDAVLPHCNTILDSAKDKQWETVRREFDATQHTVRLTMESMKDKALAECVSVGGWLAGTQVITSVITKHYTADKAELLNQPHLVEYFRASMKKAIAHLPNSDKLKLVSTGLKHIQDVMGDGSATLDKESVEAIHRITSELVATIISKH